MKLIITRTVIVRSNNNSGDKNENNKYRHDCGRVTDVNAARILKKYCISGK